MLRKFTRIDIEDRRSELWIDDRHVTHLGASSPSHTWLVVGGVQFKVQGNARDVALTLNGHFDE
jgi:hypothetical protein